MIIIVSFDPDHSYTYGDIKDIHHQFISSQSGSQEISEYYFKGDWSIASRDSWMSWLRRCLEWILGDHMNISLLIVRWLGQGVDVNSLFNWLSAFPLDRGVDLLITRSSSNDQFIQWFSQYFGSIIYVILLFVKDITFSIYGIKSFLIPLL